MNACHPSFIGSSFVANQNDSIENGKAAMRVPVEIESKAETDLISGKQNAAIKHAFCLIISPFLFPGNRIFVFRYIDDANHVLESTQSSDGGEGNMRSVECHPTQFQ